MTTALIQFIVAGTAIVVGGIGLARTADKISRITGLGQLLAGALLTAVATSLPDLAVGIHAARNGWVDLVVGDLLGAALMNLLVLGVLDMLKPSRGRMLSRMAAAHALSATMTMTLLALVGVALFLPAEMNFTIGGIGIGLWAVAVAYGLGLRLVFFDQRFAARQAGLDRPPPETEAGLTRPIVGYVLAAALIIIAAPWLTRSANDLAELSGLGGTFVGTALLPVSTTLPELTVGLAAVGMGAFPLAVGNAFGSIAFNLLLMAPIDIAYDGSLLAAASPVHIVTCLAAILITAIVVMGQLYHAERRIHFVEPDALLVIVLVFAALGLVYYLS